MFIQVIRGKVKDPAEAKAVGQSWQTECRPGAVGYLGSTAGVADDGTQIVIVRFDSQEAAEANGARPEQSTWWQDKASKVYDGDPTFYNCPDVITMGGGGSDDAGFVQVMIYKPKDLQPIRDMATEFEKYSHLRPDLIGATTAFASDGTVIDTNYFSSEEEAREGEKREWPAEVEEMMAGFEDNAGEVTFVDLKDPWLY